MYRLTKSKKGRVLSEIKMGASKKPKTQIEFLVLSENTKGNVRNNPKRTWQSVVSQNTSKDARAVSKPKHQNDVVNQKAKHFGGSQKLCVQTVIVLLTLEAVLLSWPI